VPPRAEWTGAPARSVSAVFGGHDGVGGRPCGECDMTSGAADGQVDLEPVVACALREKEAVAVGDAAGYLAVLSSDAVFMPPGSVSKSGGELRTWLAEFVRDWRIEWLNFASTEVAAVGDLAYHTYAYTWRATPRSGGDGRMSSGKGLHVLRRQRDGSWRIAREIWNSVPA
jgi:ketosteroid isomerase-like protein